MNTKISGWPFYDVMNVKSIANFNQSIDQKLIALKRALILFKIVFFIRMFNLGFSQSILGLHGGFDKGNSHERNKMQLV